MAQQKVSSSCGCILPRSWIKDCFTIHLTLTILSVFGVFGSSSILVLQSNIKPSTKGIDGGTNNGMTTNNTATTLLHTSFIEPTTTTAFSSVEQSEKLLSSTQTDQISSQQTIPKQISLTSNEVLSSSNMVRSTNKMISSLVFNQTTSLYILSSGQIVSQSSSYRVSSSDEISSSSILPSSYKPFSSQGQDSLNTPNLTKSFYGVSSALIFNHSSIYILSSSSSISNESSHDTSSSSILPSSHQISSSFYFNQSSYQSLLPSSCSIIIKTETICQSSRHYMNISTINPSVPHQSSAINSTVSSQLFSSIRSSQLMTTANHSDVYTKTTSLRTSTILTSISVQTSHIQSTYSISPSISSITIKSAEVLKPALHKCDIVANDFSKALNNYTTCVLMNLKPMEVCFGCVTEFESMRFHHRKVYHDCGKHLIGNYNARYQVVAQLFEIQQKTWNSLQCEKCYDRHSQTPQMLPKFQKFRKLYGDIKHCFAVHSNKGNKTLNGSDANNSSVCIQCLPLYQELQSEFKYQEDSEENTDTFWCADINVAVNDTRHRWSGPYHCGVKEKDLASIIALTCFFCFLPIVFYVGAKLHADVKERKTNRYYDSD